MNKLRQNPERMAWTVLAGAFTVFCLLTISVPSSIYWYAVTATETLPAELTSVRGIVLISSPIAERPSSITDGESVAFETNNIAITNDTSQAIITFADDSSLTLYSNTTVQLIEAQQPRFSFSNNPARITVQVRQGRIRATTARDRAGLAFDVYTPHTAINLNQGSFSVEVTEAETQATTRLGEAEISDGSQTLQLTQGQRAIAGNERPLSSPLSAAQNLLSNSNFGGNFGEAWETYTITPIDSVTATATVIPFQNRPVLNLRSEGSDNAHSEVGVIQMVNKDVRDFQSVRVFAEVRIAYQSLPGGGQLGSEFPIMLHIAYRDINGIDRDWFHGFYYSPPPDNYILYDQPDNANERIARYLWYPYESVNLLASLGPAKPAFITSIRIYASGWLYDSMVANISLLAEE